MDGKVAITAYSDNSAFLRPDQPVKMSLKENTATTMKVLLEWGPVAYSGEGHDTTQRGVCRHLHELVRRRVRAVTSDDDGARLLAEGQAANYGASRCWSVQGCHKGSLLSNGCRCREQLLPVRRTGDDAGRRVYRVLRCAGGVIGRDWAIVGKHYSPATADRLQGRAVVRVRLCDPVARKRAVGERVISWSCLLS